MIGQRVWGKNMSPINSSRLFWQESTIADLSTIMPFDFDTAKIPFHDVTDGWRVVFRAVPVEHLKRARRHLRSAAVRYSASGQEFLPLSQQPADAVQTKKVDLTKGGSWDRF